MNLSRYQKNELIKFARINSQDGLYLEVHERRVARDAEALARELGVDPDVCWTAGLTHDLGYGLPGPSEEHPLRSQQITSELLLDLGTEASFIDMIGGAIINHDRKLNPLTYPLEDIVVCQVDAGSFFKYYKGMAIWLYHMRVKNGAPLERVGRVKKILLDHADETESYLTMSEIKRRYQPYIDRFHKRIENLEVASLLT